MAAAQAYPVRVDASRRAPLPLPADIAPGKCRREAGMPAAGRQRTGDRPARVGAMAPSHRQPGGRRGAAVLSMDGVGLEQDRDQALTRHRALRRGAWLRR